jgi:hypothetical protein
MLRFHSFTARSRNSKIRRIDLPEEFFDLLDANDNVVRLILQVVLKVAVLLIGFPQPVHFDVTTNKAVGNTVTRLVDVFDDLLKVILGANERPERERTTGREGKESGKHFVSYFAIT